MASQRATSGNNPWNSYGSNADDGSGSGSGGGLGGISLDLTKYYHYTVPAGQTHAMFAFVSVGYVDSIASAGMANTYGNFLDGVHFQLYHPLSGSTTPHGSAVVSSSDGSSEGTGASSGHQVTVDNSLATYVIDGQTLELQAVVTGVVSGSTATANSGYFFAGWYDNAEGTGTPVSTEVTFTPPKANAAYYAKFGTKKTVVITVNGNNDTVSYDGTEHSISGYSVSYTVNGTAVPCPAGIVLTPNASADANAVARGTNVVTDGYSMALSEADFTVTDTSAEYGYRLIANPGKLTITPIAVTIDIVGNTDTKLYNGSAQSVTGYTITSTVPDGIVVSLKSGFGAVASGTDARDTKYMMGLSADSFDVTGASAGNYSVTLHVTDGWLLITRSDRPSTGFSADGYSGQYDGNPHGITVHRTPQTGDVVYYSTTGLTGGWSTTAPTCTDVTGGDITVYVKVENPNYATVSTQATITITPRPVTIGVNNAEKYYGGTDPAFTGTITAGSLVHDGDLGTISYRRIIGPGGDETVGLYDDVLTADDTANSNYIVTVVPGDFRIKTVTVPSTSVSATGGSRIFDGTPPGSQRAGSRSRWLHRLL
ncbi:MAG: hypothetical protein J6E42_05365 [Firmicutes bacterium]|nr:hypothetical protein [Bacillota bacterium]